MRSAVREESFNSVKVFWLDTDLVLTRLRERAEELLRDTRIQKVVLFGSLAEGRAVPGSDADLLIVLEDDDRTMKERIDAIEAALKVYKQTAKPVLINSIMCRPERYQKMIPIAAQYNADFIALMWGPEGLPRDENERAALCVELLYAANEAGIPNEKIWVDGIVTPVNIQQPQLMSLMAFQAMIQDIAPGAKSTCGLSNISNGPPTHLRPILNQTYMIMLERNGMYSVISDPLDERLTEIAKGKRPDLVEMVHKAMDGEAPAANTLPKEMADYVKTVDVILGRTLYSDSWLEI